MIAPPTTTAEAVPTPMRTLVDVAIPAAGTTGGVAMGDGVLLPTGAWSATGGLGCCCPGL
jgi:hypothetical protein